MHLNALLNLIIIMYIPSACIMKAKHISMKSIYLSYLLVRNHIIMHVYAMMLMMMFIAYHTPHLVGWRKHSKLIIK